MTITVKDFLSMAWSKTDGVAIRECVVGDQSPRFMAVMTAVEGYGDWIVDMFSVDPDMFGHNKILHLWIVKKD